MSDNKFSDQQHEKPVDEVPSRDRSASESLQQLIDDHEEEVSIDGRLERHRGIYFLPSLFTTAALFAGFYAIVNAMNGLFEVSAIAIYAAMIFDGLDGRIARLTNTQSKFGAEYDSLADVVSFGVAPALVVFSWALSPLGKYGWAAAFVYVACAALRLAKFNTQIDTADKNYFSGLPSPPAAAVMAGMVWVANDAGLTAMQLPFELQVLAAVVTVVVGVLMIINVPYNSFKGLDFRRRVPFVVMILLVMLFGVVMMDPPRVLLTMAILFAASGPVVFGLKKLRQRH